MSCREVILDLLVGEEEARGGGAAGQAPEGDVGEMGGRRGYIVVIIGGTHDSAMMK